MSNILLVEDDHWLAASYQRILERQGYQVASVSSADEAMRMIEVMTPQILIADVLLEGHTIFTLLHELQSYYDTQQIPVIVCSGIDPSTLAEKDIARYGVKRVLQKSELTPEVLCENVAEVLS